MVPHMECVHLPIRPGHDRHRRTVPQLAWASLLLLVFVLALAAPRFLAGLRPGPGSVMLTGTLSAIMVQPTPPHYLRLTHVDDPMRQSDTYGVFLYRHSRLHAQQAGERRTITLEELQQRGQGRRVQVVFTGGVMTSMPPAVEAQEVLLLDP